MHHLAKYLHITPATCHFSIKKTKKTKFLFLFFCLFLKKIWGLGVARQLPPWGGGWRQPPLGVAHRPPLGPFLFEKKKLSFFFFSLLFYFFCLKKIFFN
jgi:hypothetical protein